MSQREAARALNLPCWICGGIGGPNGEACRRCQGIPEDKWDKLMTCLDLVTLGRAPALAIWQRGGHRKRTEEAG